ncbi:hypothetical protein [Streptomyces cavernicola]|uniref:Uncharacterized protein n=1 Tax=Streptomyces cavernicola TaxID=3043613 RepID=A0ABT6SEC6_9ACTN|nr:hypothetical protein [Streptomyces sp. B-S-A6]MDI3406335.1 hypothetical protein [Streptomyces sp. B-S-A6]
MLLLVLGLFLTVFSLGFTVEMESFPGLRDNVAPIAVVVVLIGGLCGLAGAMLCARSTPRTAAVLGLCLLAAVGWRTYALAPMLPCWSHESVARNEDGSYTCYDR